MRLGGWFRFGIVIATLYGVFIAFVFYNERPRLEPLQDAWFDEAAEVISESISKSILKEEGREISASTIREHVRKDANMMTVDWLEAVAASPSEKQKPFSDAVARVNKKHEALIFALPDQQRKHWLIAFVSWVGGILLLFASGYTTRWVYRGFRQAKNN